MIKLRSSLTALSLAVLLTGCVAHGDTGSVTTGSAAGSKTFADTARTKGPLPSLIVSDTPPPEVIYRRGSRDTVLAREADAPVARMGRMNDGHVETLVTRKVTELGRDLRDLERKTDGFADHLRQLQSANDVLASDYYAVVAFINTELQAGTTAGNPVLTDYWNRAQSKLDALSQSASRLNDLAADIANEASRGAWLQESVHATYGLSGAVSEDHEKLRGLEDSVNRNIVAINRQLTAVNDEINRRAAFLRVENLNMQTLSLAIANGELYGRNMANTLYRKVAEDGRDIFSAQAAAGTSVPARRPLVIIRFDRSNVDYEQALYTAVNQALEKYPQAQFDLVAISTMQGNPAQVALAAAEARTQGENVLRALTRMGLPLERINLNAATSKDVANTEVHLYIR